MMATREINKRERGGGMDEDNKQLKPKQQQLQHNQNSHTHHTHHNHHQHLQHRLNPQPQPHHHHHHHRTKHRHTHPHTHPHAHTHTSFTSSSSQQQQHTTTTFPPLSLLLLPLLLLLLFCSLVPPCAAICPSNCTCDGDSYVVRCGPSNIDVMPFTFHPKLQQLTMYGTEIHTLDVNSFSWYDDLRHVNLSKNMIRQVKPETFKKQKYLEELHLAENNITNLTADMFTGLSNLIVLSLRNNSIRTLEGAVFMNLTHLQDLDLSQNQIEQLEEKALLGLSNLRVLHLSENKLTVIPASNLALVPDLAELTLGWNFFTAVYYEDFHSMRGLRSLDLSGAGLKEGLRGDSFDGLGGLRRLRMQSCGLTVVPSVSFGSLVGLEELDIGRNQIAVLPTNAFRDNHNLNTLHVSHCPELTHVDANFLEANLNIREIVMTNNPKLTYIAPDALRLLMDLTVLDLRDNNIQMITENAASWGDIPYWNLEGNPIACNCSSAWLRELIIETNTSAGLTCASPPRLTGTHLHLTELSDLACGMDSATRGLVIGLVVCFLVVVVAAVVVVMLYRHHNSCIHRLLKGHRLRGHGGRCEHSYTHSHSYHHPAYTVTPTKPVPVTEL